MMLTPLCGPQRSSARLGEESGLSEHPSKIREFCSMDSSLPKFSPARNLRLHVLLFGIESLFLPRFGRPLFIKKGRAPMRVFLTFLLLLASAATGLTQKTESKSSAGHDDAAALTIYNQSFAVVRQTLPLDLKSGTNQV